MKKLSIAALITLLLLAGCSFNIQVLTPPPPSPEPPQTFTPDPVETTVPVSLPASPIPVMEYTPTSSDPVIFGAYMAEVQGAQPGQTAFPAGTKQLFAHWHYANMRAGLTIKREWLLNGQPWLMREEPWDFAKYGATGMQQDVSVQDFEAGLPSGFFELRIYIDNALQPIGVVYNGQPEAWIRFEVFPPEGETLVVSPDTLWTASVLDGRRLTVNAASGASTELYTGTYIQSVAWLPDSRHLLFVDRDPQGPPIGPALSRPGELWIADVQTREARSLYKSHTTLAEIGGLMLSADGRYVAAVEGSGYGDACFLDAKMIFFEVGSDYRSVKSVSQDLFTGLPVPPDGMLYLPALGEWLSTTQYRVALNATCTLDESLSGFYIFDVSTWSAARENVPSVAGDLGWGEIHGRVTDAVTGGAIEGATVACEQTSYTAPVRCSGSVVTRPDGSYIFAKVFFHDTDTIRLTVTAPGYQAQGLTSSAFTINDLTADFSLKPVP